MSAPRRPATANGLKIARRSGRSPKPLPARIEGLKVSNDSAPAAARPVPPTSQFSAIEATASRLGSRRNWYFTPTSRFPKPVVVGFPSGLKIGRASCRERVEEYVVVGAVKKQNHA